MITEEQDQRKKVQEKMRHEIIEAEVKSEMIARAKETSAI